MSSQNSLTTLKRQAAAFRREHVIPEGQTARKRQAAPSVLFTLVEARSFDAEAVATLAQHGLAAIGAIDPDAIGFGALFEGPPQDRDLLTAVENTRLNKELRALLLLLSPHLMLRAAQEVLEGLLHRFHVHRWNVDDVIACALPYHDSTLFTKLLQGLHVAGKPRWSWLQPLKEKPSTLIRPTLAKYCAKDYSVLAFIGELLQETSALQKTNRPLSTLFTAVWLDALAGVASPGPDLVLTALPPLLASLRRPHLRDVFHAAVSVGGALCVKVELEPAVKAQLLERAAKHASGELGLTSLAFMALVLQLQAGDGFPAKALHSVLAAGSEAVLQALPPRVDCGNLLAVLVEASILQAASGAENGEDEDPEAFVEGLLSVSAIVDQYGSPIALALLQVFQKLCVDQAATAAEQKTIAALLRKPLKAIGARQPMALSAALTKAVDYFAARGAKTDALAQLVASDGDVGSVPLVDSDGSIVDVIRAFSDKSAKKRGKAVQKAVADLERSVKSETDLTRQRVLVSLLLQAAQDEDLEVAKKTLQLEVLWAQLPQADAATTVPFLLSLLARLLPDTRVSGDSLEALFKSLFLGDARVRVLTPLVIRCLALVYSRADCEEALRRSVDISLLPLLVLSIVGLDLLANKKELEGQDELRTAVMHFCAASKHGLFARFKSGTATTLSKIPASSIDCSVVTGLCHLVQGRPWAAVQVEELRHPLAQSVLIGGKAAQMAAVALLGDKLPGLLETTANDASDEIEQVLMQCAEACECFARHQSYMEAGDCDGSELLCKLSQVVVSAVTAVCSKQGGMASSSTSTPTKRTRMRKKSVELGASGGSGTASDSLQQALVKLLRVALERPRSMSAVLRGALGAGSQFVRPALLQLALAPEQHSGSGTRGRITATVTTNALLVLHGLLSSKAADEWGPDQSLVVPLTAKLAHTGSPEVRKAVLSLLELLRDVDWDALVPPSWQSHCAAGLRQAGIVRSHQALLSAKGWAAVSEQEFMLAGVPKKSLQAFLDHLSSHKAEILQDGSAVGPLLAQFLVAKGGIVKSARMNDCAFWSAGLSMLEQPAGIVASPLVSVVPSSGFLASLKEPLRCSLEEVVASLSAKGAGLTEAPLLLRVAALKVSEMTAGGQLPAGLGEKGEAASRTALGDFIQGLVLPLCSGISDHAEQKRGPVPELIADLACALVAVVPQALKVQASPELNAVTAKELLRLCVASAPAPKTAPAEDALGVSASVFSAAHSAFVSAPMEATLLCQMLKSPAFKAKSVGSSSRRTAIEAIYQHIVGFDNACPGSGALLVELGELAKRESKVMVDADESLQDGPMSFTMLSIAALSENIGSFGDTSGDIPASLASVCTSLSEISNTLGSKLTSGMLASIVRSCNALLPSAKMDSSSATPPPVLTCVEALGCFKHALAPEVLGLLKVSLRRFWKYTEQAEGDLLALQEKSAQSHIRLLLQTMIVRCPGLLPDVTPDLCLSLARSVGLNASLDFAALAILARRLVAGPGRKRSNKRRASKKEAEQDAAVEEALGAAVNYGDELALDEVTTMFVSVGCGNRFHGLGTLAQTLSSLCLELSKPGEPGLGKSGQSFWGPSLLPESFVQDVGKEHAFRALEMGLASMHRVIEEHGLPEALDDVKIDATAYRSASGISTEDAIEDDKYTVVLSLCYVVKATCVIEALLDGAPDMSTASVEPCKTRVRELRGLLLRSLSVNHPQTFFQAVCFGLQVEGLSRTPGKKDLLAKEDFRIVETRHLLKSTSEALRKRRELISATNGNADDEDALEAQSACAPLCTAALRHVCQNMLRKSDSANNSAEELHVIIWRFLDGLCRFSARAAPTPVLEECLPAAALCLQKVVSNDSKSGARSAVACCLCLLTAVEELGRGILPCLDKILPSVLDLVGSSSFRGVDQGPEIDDLALLEISSLQLLQTLIKKLGAFLSPYLERICLLLIAPGPLQRVKLLQGLGKEVVASVPHRLLLPAVQSGVATAASHLAGDGADSAIDKVDSCLINLQRFGVMLVWIFSVASPEFVSSFAEVATDSIVRLLAVGPAAAGRFLHLGGRAEDLPIRILRRDLHQKALLVADSDELAWSQWCTESSVLRMNALGAAAFTHFSLRLSIDDLKPRFLTILDWARNTQLQALTKQSTRKAAVEVDILADTDDACRVLALCSVMQGLASEAPEISEELFLPLALKDLVSCLAAGQRQARHLAAKHRANSKRKRRALSGGEWANTSRSSEVLHGHTWWWFEVMRATFGFITQSLRHAGGSASQTKVVDEAVEILIDPVAEALAICEFLPAYEDSGLTSAFLEAIQTALVVLAAASDGQRIKRLLTAVLSKSRSEDPELRLCSVKACHRIWADIGVQAVSGLSEVLMFAVELLEDEDPRVEGAVRSLVKTMETCTGESLQEHLKQ